MEEGGKVKGKTYQCETWLPRSGSELGVAVSGAHEAIDLGAVCLRVPSDPEFAVCGVDGGEMDGGAGVDGDEAKVGGCLAGEKGSGGREREESGA